MKNKNLRDLITKKGTLVPDTDNGKVTILNNEELAMTLGGSQLTECPKLTSCTTFGDCNAKCVVFA
jgi:hypothetical protein